MTITNGYVTLDQMVTEIGTGADPSKGVAAEAAITAASRQIDDYTGRRFWRDAVVVAREFYADDAGELMSMPGAVMDISTTTGLIVKLDDGDNGTFSRTLTINTDYVLTPANAADDGEPFTSIRLVDGNYYFPRSSSGRPGVQVTARFGFTAVPSAIAQACLIQSVLLYKATDAAMGGLSFGDAGFMRVRGGLNPIAQTLVERYRFASVA